MTAVIAVPYAEQAAFPECVLPACHGIADRIGAPCADCVKAFGPMLIRNPDAEPLTAAAIVERDASVRDAIRHQRAARPAPVELERKSMQVCWLCEERHTCTRTADGWECDTCREVTP